MACGTTGGAVRLVWGRERCKITMQNQTWEVIRVRLSASHFQTNFIGQLIAQSEATNSNAIQIADFEQFASHRSDDGVMPRWETRVWALGRGETSREEPKHKPGHKQERRTYGGGRVRICWVSGYNWRLKCNTNLSPMTCLNFRDCARWRHGG